MGVQGSKQELQKQRELTAQLTANHKKDLDLLGERQLDLQKVIVLLLLTDSPCILGERKESGP